MRASLWAVAVMAWGASEAGAHAAVEVAEVGVAAGQRLGGDAQCAAGAAVGLAGFGGEHLAAALVVGRAQGKPTGEGGGVGEATEVGADLGQQGVRGKGADAGDAVRSTPKMRWSSGPSRSRTDFCGVCVSSGRRRAALARNRFCR